MTSGNRPAPEQGSWRVPGAASAYQQPEEPTRGAGRGRPGLVALIVALTELVIIGAACNQSVAKHALQYVLDHSDTFLGRAVMSSLEFSWRVTPRSSDNHDGYHTYDGQLIRIGVLVVLSALLAGVAARGVVTFWRMFFAVWTAVVAASCVGRICGALVSKPAPRFDRATNAVFLSIDGSTFFAGAVLGLIAALIAALVARATRRAVEPPVPAGPEPAYAAPEPPPPFYGNAPQQHPQPQPAGYGEADGRTTQLPRFDQSGGEQWSSPEVRDTQTTRSLPRSDDGEATQAMPSDPGDDRR